MPARHHKIGFGSWFWLWFGLRFWFWFPFGGYFKFLTQNIHTSMKIKLFFSHIFLFLFVVSHWHFLLTLCRFCFIFSRIFVALRILRDLRLGRLNKFRFKRFRHTPYTKKSSCRGVGGRKGIPRGGLRGRHSTRSSQIAKDNKINKRFAAKQRSRRRKRNQEAKTLRQKKNSGMG